ncbi:hypothetical protein Tco_1333857, partial [Tanacetum coccineum]
VMAISTILISSDSSEENVVTPSGRVLWFGRIPTIVPVNTPTIDPPVIYDDTLLIPTKTPTISPITSTIPPTAPTTHYTSPFIHTDSSNDDTPDTPSPTHKIPPVEVAPPTSQILPTPFGVRRRRVTIVSPGQPIPHGRPYRYHPYGPIHIMTARKRVGPLPTHRLVVRHSIDYSSSDYFTFDDSSRDSPSGSSSEAPLDSSSDALSDSSFGHSSSDHSSPALPSGMRSSHQLRSSVSSIPHSSVAITEDHLILLLWVLLARGVGPLPHWYHYLHLYLEHCLFLRDDVVVRGAMSLTQSLISTLRFKQRLISVLHMRMLLELKGIDAKVVVKTAAREEVETSVKGMVEVRVDKVTHLVVLDDILEPAQEEGAIGVAHETLGDMVQRFHDHTVEVPVHRVQVIESIQRDQGYMIIATGQKSVV